MKHLTKFLLTALIFGVSSQSALANDGSECELLLVRIVPAADGNGEAQIASYTDAKGFLKTVHDDVPGHMTMAEGQSIRALMCRRNDVIPAHDDYDVISTGIPFILSQDFDSPDTDSLTLYWKDDKIEHVYKGYPLSEEAEAILETRLAGFTKRGLNPMALEAAKMAQEAKAHRQRIAEDAANAQSDETGSQVDESEVITTAKPRETTKTENQSELEAESETEMKTETEE